MSAQILPFLDIAEEDEVSTSFLVYPDEDFVSSLRELAYIKILDPKYLKTLGRREVEKILKGDSGNSDSKRLRVGEASDTPNIILSVCEDGLHRPCFDVDIFDHNIDEGSVVEFIRSQIRRMIRGYGTLKMATGPIPLIDVENSSELRIVVARSTSHWHVYMPNLVLDTTDYFNFLNRLCVYGILEEGYVLASRNQGASALRLADCPKFAIEDIFPTQES